MLSTTKGASLPGGFTVAAKTSVSITVQGTVCGAFVNMTYRLFEYQDGFSAFLASQGVTLEA